MARKRAASSTPASTNWLEQTGFVLGAAGLEDDGGEVLGGEDAGSVPSPLLAELKDVLWRPKFAKQLAARGLPAQNMFDGYAALATHIKAAVITPTIARDPDDDAVIACALAASADLVVSGDAHLLNLKHYQGIPIVMAAEAAKRIAF